MFARFSLFVALGQIFTLSLAEGVAGAAEQKYKPTAESLAAHPVPDWFEDAKFGIFIHWGLYSVPAWAPTTGELGKVSADVWWQQNPYAEWYLNTLRNEGSPTWQHHKETYGEDFDYYNFAGPFNKAVEQWRPKAWARLFKEVGAKYVVLTSKHHDGFTLWPSRVDNPHLADDRQSCSRDLVGELTAAVRAEGLTMGLYYSGGLDWSFCSKAIVNDQDLYGTLPQGEEYARYVDSHWRELIERYEPAVLWNDIAYPAQANCMALFADYYNQFPDGVVDNRWSVEHYDFTTPEYSKYDKITPKKWESCRGIGYSFGYNRAEGDEHMISADGIVDLLVDCTSKNGNLLLNVGPKADGTIPAGQVERLRAVGKWLAVNGEAIYGSRPWGQYTCGTPDGTEVRFTQKGEVLYAILLNKPAGATVTLEKVFAQDGTTIKLLGRKGNVSFCQDGANLVISVGDELGNDYAYVLKMTPKPWRVVP